MLPDSFDPNAIETFRYVDAAYDDATSTATFTYALDAADTTVVTCVETYAFPPPSTPPTGSRRDAFERLLAQLFLAAGLSYYKLAAPPNVHIECGTWTIEEIAFQRRLLAKGLGEFSFVNGLEPELWPVYEYRSVAESRAPLTGLALDRGPLVPVGGGKDSCVSIEALRAAGIAPTLVTVNRYPVIQDVIDDAQLPDLAVRRVLDPQLRDLNARGARNGHVPATAIVSLAVCAAAVLHGYDAVVMSNERSASEGNVTYRGVEINHQWSKSAEAETMLRSLVAGVTPELAYFSFLRPLSELSIAQRFAATCERYLDSFSSCNAAFRLDPARRVSRWCGQCPKCQFVYLALATVLDRPMLRRIWGAELFGSSPVAGFEALLGLTEWKPFECVGETRECAVALRLVREREAWRGHAVLDALAARLADEGRTATDGDVVAMLTAATLDLSSVPSSYAYILNGVPA